MAEDRTIVELMAVPTEDHDITWLEDSLQAAVKLEFFTLPPYLCAEWSLKGGANAHISQSIHVVLREEMLHFGLMCNLVTAIGKVPRINTAGRVPTYPNSMPGGVNPRLRVSLRALSTDAAKRFMEIEFPESGPVTFAEEFPTIGAFYTAIQEAFDRLNPSLSETNQIAGPLGLTKLRSPAEVRDAIKLIKQQGEGSKDSPEDTGPTDLAHYYRFGEMHHLRKLIKDSRTGKWGFTGDPIELGEIRPMAEIPPGGYKPEDVSVEVNQMLLNFDRTYTEMLGQLQTAWESGNAASLRAAVGTMIDMQGIGTDLMDVQIPGRAENYGPCFRLAS